MAFKLELIHQVKYAYGKGIGKPARWMIGKQRKPNKYNQAPKNEPKSHSIDTDETGGFGSEFDPADWV